MQYDLIKLLQPQWSTSVVKETCTSWTSRCLLYWSYFCIVWICVIVYLSNDEQWCLQLRGWLHGVCHQSQRSGDCLWVHQTEHVFRISWIYIYVDAASLVSSSNCFLVRSLSRHNNTNNTLRGNNWPGEHWHWHATLESVWQRRRAQAA